MAYEEAVGGIYTYINNAGIFISLIKILITKQQKKNTDNMFCLQSQIYF